MKCMTSGTFPRLREQFKNSVEIGKVINRSKDAVMRRFKSGFTNNEQILILRHLGLEDTEQNRKEIFKK